MGRRSRKGGDVPEHAKVSDLTGDLPPPPDWAKKTPGAVVAEKLTLQELEIQRGIRDLIRELTNATSTFAGVTVSIPVPTSVTPEVVRRVKDKLIEMRTRKRMTESEAVGSGLSTEEAFEILDKMIEPRRVSWRRETFNKLAEKIQRAMADPPKSDNSSSKDPDAAALAIYYNNRGVPERLRDAAGVVKQNGPRESYDQPTMFKIRGGRKTSKIGNKFNRCVKSVRSTVRARKGSNKESAAIAICTTSVLQTRGRTLKRYRKGRLTTQARLRGGELPAEDRAMLEKSALVTGKPPATPVQEEPEWVRSTFEAPLPPGWTALGAVARDADEQEVVYRHPMGKPRPADDKLPTGIVKRDGKYYAKRVSAYKGSRRSKKTTRRR